MRMMKRLFFSFKVCLCCGAILCGTGSYISMYAEPAPVFVSAVSALSSASILASAVPAATVAQDSLESFEGLYFFKADGSKAASKDAADYYRVVDANNYFRDYYVNSSSANGSASNSNISSNSSSNSNILSTSKSVTGDALRAEGKVVFIDAANDNNSVFEGKFIAYYLSGKIWIRQFFKEGKNDGEFTEYFENGGIKEHDFYKDGVLDGLKSEFAENGDTCYQYEYENGKLVNDYYTQSGNGYSVNYNNETKKPEWRQTAADEVHAVLDKAGDSWKYYTANGLYIAVNVRYKHYYGRYYLTSVYIQNNSPEDAYLDFNNMSISGLSGGASYNGLNSGARYSGQRNGAQYSEQGNGAQYSRQSNGARYSGQRRIRMFSKDEYVNRVNNRQAWAAFGLSMATVVTAVTLDAAINGSYYDSWDRSPGSDFWHDLSSVMITEAAVVGNVLIAGYMTNEMIKVQQNNIGYLQNYLIKPKNAICGYALAKYDSSSSKILVNVPVNGVVYSFSWDASDMKAE